MAPAIFLPLQLRFLESSSYFGILVTFSFSYSGTRMVRVVGKGELWVAVVLNLVFLSVALYAPVRSQFINRPSHTKDPVAAMILATPASMAATM